MLNHYEEHRRDAHVGWQSHVRSLLRSPRRHISHTLNTSADHPAANLPLFGGWMHVNFKCARVCAL